VAATDVSVEYVYLFRVVALVLTVNIPWVLLPTEANKKPEAGTEHAPELIASVA
jgi:hypothetical protein